MKMIAKSSNEQITTGLFNDEFRCKCSNPSCRATLIDERLINAYKNFRLAVGVPLTINSGYRCPWHNNSIGGAALSRHTSGEALDISLHNLLSAFTIQEIIDKLKAAGFTYTRYYQAENFIHADTRE